MIYLMTKKFINSRYQYIGDDCLKEGIGQFADLRGDSARKRVWCS